jgi:F0F1-type ATP synthase membrane subunit b/b'
MKQKFSNAYDLSRWVNREILFWQWLSLFVHSEGDYRFLTGYQALRQLGADIDAVLASPSSSDQIQKQWDDQIAALYSNDRVLESSSPKAQLVESTRRSDPELGFYVLAFFHESLSSFNNPKAIEGALIALLYKKGVRKNVEAERTALQRLREEWQEVFSETKREYEDSKIQNRQIVATSDSLIQRMGEDLRKQISKDIAESKGFRFELSNSVKKQLSQYATEVDGFVNQYSDKLKDAEAKLNSLIATYYQHLALKSPVEYWEENRETHKASARTYLIWLATTGPICGFIVFSAGWVLIGRDPQPVWGHIVLFATVAALVVWALRVLMKLYLSHMHLETSARERVVMAKTYLALMSEGVKVGDKERSIVMESLFRPATTGILKDDGLQTSAVELLSRLLKSEK